MIVKSEAEVLYIVNICAVKLPSMSVTCWFRGCYMGRPFIISAPNLVKLKYERDLAVFHGHREFKSLQSAEIIVKIFAHTERSQVMTCQSSFGS